MDQNGILISDLVAELADRLQERLNYIKYCSYHYIIDKDMQNNIYNIL